MALLPSRTNFHISASSVLSEIKKGGDEKRNEFVWLNQERVYAIALLATGNHDHAQELTIAAFKNAFASLSQKMPKKDSELTIWQWLSDFIVEACAEYHAQNSDPPNENPNIDPAADGSANMDWETTVLLGVQRIKRCLGSLPEDQLKVFYLRHHLDLNYDQISTVLNQTVEQTMSALFRARVQIVKCLGRG
ncbi:MAG: sigma-70 family RNA polymerase sigma factor [Candidatus Melainabacteria bacterium]|nr:sigma-70 family RNA polymerase sigma factor [Candidatus Melainabacteria bacterium]